MSYDVDCTANNNEFNKLPRITRSMVSPTLHNTSSLRDQAGEWAADIRRRWQLAIDNGEDPDDSDIEALRQEIISSFISSLQCDSHVKWLYLQEVVTLLIPFKDHLINLPEVPHYLERIYHHFEVNKARLFDVQLLAVLSQVFPKESERLKSQGAHPAHTYCTPEHTPRATPTLTPRYKNVKSPLIKPDSFLPPSSKPKKASKFSLPDGQNPYDTDVPESDERMFTGHVKLTDLRLTIPQVIAEIANGESVWGKSAGLLSQAADVDIPEDIKQIITVKKSAKEVKSLIDEGGPEMPAEKLAKEPMTGRQAVLYFAKCYHTGKIRHMYFNIAPSRLYSPYDLVAVPKNKINPEHYVFSTFGVLHVYGDRPSENMSLADWHRETVFYRAIRVLPFFRDFLLGKIFKRWLSNKRFSDFCKRRKEMSKKLLLAIPTYGQAYLEVAHLLQELEVLQFLPLDAAKTYQLAEFENNVNYRNMMAEKNLGKFFTFCKMIVDNTREHLMKKLHYTEEQYRHKTAVFTKDSLYLQRTKKEQRQANLKEARDEMKVLGNFVRLIDHVILARLVSIARDNVEQFVKDIVDMSPDDLSRNGLFKINITFTDKGVVGMSPSREQYTRVLGKTLNDIPSILSEAAIPLDGSVEAKPLDNVLDEPERVPSYSNVKRHHQESSMGSVGQFPEGDDMFGDEAESLTRASSVSQITDPMEALGVSKDKEMLSTPRFMKDDFPDKEDDRLGVATPDLVMRMETPTYIEGEGFVGQYDPLGKENIEQKLFGDESYKSAMNLLSSRLRESLEEIQQYCDDQRWLDEIYQFCIGWKHDSLQEFRKAQAFAIEQKLAEIRNWSERVRLLEKNFMTENGFFMVDCMEIQRRLIPKLNHIYREIVQSVADEATNSSKKFCQLMTELIQSMKEKKTDISYFASYAKRVHENKKNMVTYQERVEYIKSLFEVIRMSYRPTSEEEEKHEAMIQSQWELFLAQLQDATEFVNIQTPVMSKDLEDTYESRQAKAKSKKAREEATKNPSEFMKLEKEAHALCNQMMTGKYLDPSQRPMALLASMQEIQNTFSEVQARLQETSKWKESITNVPHNLAFIEILRKKMNIRQELWKYVETTNNSIQDWNRLPFKKLHVQKILDKIMEWQATAGHMKDHLPDGDKVLAYWFKMLTDFKQHLPLLHKLAHEALKGRHWRAIFVGFGEIYEPSWEFTVEDLLSFDLGKHSLLINSVHQGAKAEYALERQLVKLRRMWEEKEFKLAKHIPDSVYADKPKPGAPTHGKKLKRFEKYRLEKAIANTPRGLDVREENLFVLIGVEELKYLLQDSQLTLKSMLSSPFLADLRGETEAWADALRQIEEIVDLWCTCQDKWLYLLKIFEDAQIYRVMAKDSFTFVDVNNKFKEFMGVVVKDARVTSVLQKRRIDKAYRYLQGDNLRCLFKNLIDIQENVLQNLKSLLNKSRAEFPRLFFLSDMEVVQVLAISRNPKGLLPMVRKCFQGIHSLTYALPPGATELNSALDYTLNAHKLQVTAINGVYGEYVPLNKQVAANNNATQWLSTLESLMKNTMATILQTCVEARMDENSIGPSKILSELSKIESTMRTKEQEGVEDVVKEIKDMFSHWLMRFPSQSVLVAEAILWEKQMYNALGTFNKTQLTELKSDASARIDQYYSVLRDNCSQYQQTDLRSRLHILLGNLINQCLHQRDVIDSLIQRNSVNDSCFDWLKVLKYHMEMSSVLRAKTVIIEDSDTCVPQAPTQKKPSVVRSHHVSKPPSVADAPPLGPRTETTVISMNHFSPCTVHQLGASFSYEHEYIGPDEKLVFTPLTERAHIMLTASLRTFKCGTLIGPSCTGKTQTVKDLVTALGQQCFTINCSQEMTLNMAMQCIRGMILSGCWGFFDETDRMTQGLLSVVAQQLDYVQSSLNVLKVNGESQYHIRGQATVDKKTGDPLRVIRRNSLTTLHSLPVTEKQRPTIERQKTVPHGFGEEGLTTYFCDDWEVEKRQRRHSIGLEVSINESEFYKDQPKLPPLFYENYRTSHPKYGGDSQDFKYLTEAVPVYCKGYLGNLTFDGQLLRARDTYACFMTLNTDNAQYNQIPETLKHVMRPCAMVIPDIKPIVETMLYVNGFTKYKELSQKFCLFVELAKTQLPSKYSQMLSIQTIKTILADYATYRLYGRLQLFEMQAKENSVIPDEYKEDTCIVHALHKSLLSRMDSLEDETKFRNLVRDCIPVVGLQTKDITEYDPHLVSTIQEQMKHDNLQSNPKHLNKILQLYTALQSQQGVLLVGPAGSGKSTCYKTLQKVLNFLNDRKDTESDELKSEQNMVYYNKQKIAVGMQELLRGEVQRNKSQEQAQGRWKRMTSFGKASAVATGMMDRVYMKTQYPKVEVMSMNPTGRTPGELYGCFKGNKWSEGLLQHLLRNAHAQSEAAKHFIANFNEKKNKLPILAPSVIKKWMVLDGELDASWVDGLNNMLDDSRKLLVASGEQVILDSNTSVIFEMSDLVHASPSSVTRTSLIHCSSDTVPWMSLFESWGTQAKNKYVISPERFQMLQDLVSDVCGPTLKFLAKECTSSLKMNIFRSGNEAVPGMEEMVSFLRILSSLLDQHFLRETHERQERQSHFDVTNSISSRQESRTTLHSHKSSDLEACIANYVQVLKCMFSFAYIWGFGGQLHERFMNRFDVFARETLHRARHSVTLPRGCSCYDLWVDTKLGIFLKWSERPQEKSRSSNYVIVPELDRYLYLSDLLLTSHYPVMLVGQPGVGKTSLVKNMVAPRHPYVRINMSPGLTPDLFQDKLGIFLRDLNQRTSDGVMPGSKTTLVNGRSKERLLFFLDDLNTASVDGLGNQPTLEVLREVLGQGNVYDRKRHVYDDVTQSKFIAACSTPGVSGSGYGYSCLQMSPRLTRLFTVLTMFPLSEEGMHGLYTKTLHEWLEEFPAYSVEHHYEFARALTKGLLELYHLIKQHMRPTPTHSHYVFSYHDISKIVQGLMLLAPKSKSRPKPRSKNSKKSARHSRAKEEANKSNSNRAAGKRSISEKHKSRAYGWGGMVGRDTAPISAPMMRVIARLWCHECTRTFGDRLTSVEDFDWFEKTLTETVTKYLCTDADSSESRQAAMSAIHEDPAEKVRGTPVYNGTPPPKVAPVSTSETPSEDREKTTGESPILSPTMTGVTSEGVSPITDGLTEITEPTQSPTIGITESHSPAAESSSGDITPLTETSVSHRPTEQSTVISKTTQAETDDSESAQSETEPSSSEEPSATEESSDDASEVSQSASEAVDTSQLPSLGKRDSVYAYLSQLPDTPVSEVSDTFTRTAHSISLTIDTSSEGTMLTNKQSPTTLRVPTTPSIKRKGLARKDSKRGVTFKAGLIADRDEGEFTGALLSMEQIKGPNEKLTDFLFSKFIISAHTENTGGEAEKGYIEGVYPMLREALATCLQMYNQGTSQRVDVVFFKEAVQHMCRLSRVLALPESHALLIGLSHSTGRGTLTRLAAYIAGCKLFEPKTQSNAASTRQVLREHIKRASNVGGVNNRPVVLLVQQDLDDDCLQDVSCLIREGSCPGLYNMTELQQITGGLNAGGVTSRRMDKIDLAYEKFVSRVKQNVHVVISLNYKSTLNVSDFNSLYHKLSKFPTFITHVSSIDLYQEWSTEALVTVAETWLKDPSSGIPVQWSEVNREEQIQRVAQAMAYIHKSARSGVQRLFSHQAEMEKFYTPLTFQEFSHIFKVVASHIAKNQKQTIEKNECGLHRVDEAFKEVNQYKAKVASLMPRLQKALKDVEERTAVVQKSREHYKLALDDCRQQEQSIQEKIAPVQHCRSDAKAEFNRINPVYSAALAALRALSQHDVEEIRTYREPPEKVVLVLQAVAMLFGYEQDWETSKAMVYGANFYRELEFYDKNNMSDEVFEKLNQFITNPEFHPRTVLKASKAAASLSLWVHALYNYKKISNKMAPSLAALHAAERDLTKQQIILGQKRIEAGRIKTVLQKNIQRHRESVKEAKMLEKEIKNIEGNVTESNDMMNKMFPLFTRWRSELNLANNRLLTLPGDSLLTAAAICYYGPLNWETRDELMNDWKHRCTVGNFEWNESNVKIRKRTVLSAKLENIVWELPDNQKPGPNDVRMETTKEDTPRKLGLPTKGKTKAKNRTQTDDQKLSNIPLSHRTQKTKRIEFRNNLEIFDNAVATPNAQDPSIVISNPVAVRRDFSLDEILGSFDELSAWRASCLPQDMLAIQNALIMRVCCHNNKYCWPLLIDPDGQVETWVRLLQNSKNVIHYEESQVDFEHEQGMFNTLPEGGVVQTSQDAITLSSLDDGDYTIDQSSLYTSESRAMTATSFYTTESRPTTSRFDSISRQTSIEDIRPVTTISNPNDTVQFTVDDTLDIPEDRLIVVEADDESIDTKLITAIVKGFTVLVKNIERKPLDPLFQALILRQFSVDEDGNRIVRIGEHQLQYHTDFRLFLATSTPLFLQGDGLAKLPVYNMSVIDMTIGHHGVVNQILTTIMSLEKPEFEGQRRSIEADLLQHKEEMMKQQAGIMEKTVGLQTPLLRDSGMMDALTDCLNDNELTKTSLDEAHHLLLSLEEKRTPYVQVAIHAAMLYDVITEISMLKPLYHMKFKTYMDLLLASLKKLERGKGTSGSPKARAEELIQTTTRDIRQFFAMSLFESDIRLFDLLVAIERMTMNSHITTDELVVFVNGLDQSQPVVYDNKLDWMDEEAWAGAVSLERMLPVFNGLCRCLTTFAAQWQEYFSLPVALISPVPGDILLKLTMFQKCIIWRFCCRSRMAETCDSLVLGVLGPQQASPGVSYVQNIYKYMNEATPAILIEPTLPGSLQQHDTTEGILYTDPTHLIREFSKSIRNDDVIPIVSIESFGVHSQMAEVQRHLVEAMTLGNWLVIQNCHLAEPWNQDMLRLLKMMINTKVKPPSTETDNRTMVSKEGTELKTVTMLDSSDAIHPNFRLWCITKCNTGQILPGVLIQHGVKVACDQTSDFKVNLLQSYKAVRDTMNRAEIKPDSYDKQKGYMFPLALLHSVLNHRQGYGTSAHAVLPQWTDQDLSAALDIFRIVCETCASHMGIQETVSCIYGNHCLDNLDLNLVQKIAERLLVSRKQLQQLTDHETGIEYLLSKLSPKHTKTGSLEEALGEVIELNSTTFELSPEADQQVQTTRSRDLVKDLTYVCGHVYHDLNPVVYSESSLETYFTQLTTQMSSLPELPDTDKNELYPMEMFFHQQVECYKHLVQTVLADLAILKMASRADIAVPPGVVKVLQAVQANRTPSCWSDVLGDSSVELTRWISELYTRLKLLKSYVEEDKVRVFNLSVFIRPTQFIQAILQTHARKQFNQLHNYTFTTKFLPVGFTPESAPDTGVYIGGLQLHRASWNTQRSAAACETDSWDSILPILWLKPVEIQDSKTQETYYNCPVYHVLPNSLSTHKVALFIDLPVVEKTSQMIERKVHVSSALPQL